MSLPRSQISTSSDSLHIGAFVCKRTMSEIGISPIGPLSRNPGSSGIRHRPFSCCFSHVNDLTFTAQSAQVFGVKAVKPMEELRHINRLETGLEQACVPKLPNEGMRCPNHCSREERCLSYKRGRRKRGITKIVGVAQGAGCRYVCFIRKPFHTLKAKLVGATLLDLLFSVSPTDYLLGNSLARTVVTATTLRSVAPSLNFARDIGKNEISGRKG